MMNYMMKRYAKKLTEKAAVKAREYMVCKSAGRLRGHKVSKTALIFAGFGGVIYLANRMIPKIADDYPFSFVWDGDHHGNLAFGRHRYRRVRTLKDLARSQWSHYMTWSGRTVAETLNQLVLMKDDKIFYDRVNTAAIMSQLAICLCAARGRISLKKIPASLARMLTAGFWFCTPNLTVTSLWTTGAANYSWPSLMQSLFLLPYSMRYHDKDFSLPAPAAALTGLLAGWSNEGGGGIALALSGAAFLRSRKRGEKTKWMLSGFLGAAVGYALLMLAPGNFSRVRIEQEFSDILPSDFSDPSMVPQEYLYKPAMFLHYLKHSFSSVILRELPLDIPVLLYFIQKDRRSKECDTFILVMEAAAFSVPAMLMLSPQFPKRAAYPGIIYKMTAAVKALEEIRTSPRILRLGSKWRRALVSGRVIAYSGLLLNIGATLFVDADVYVQTQEQIRRLKENHGKEGIVQIPDIMLSPFWCRLAGDRTIDEYIKRIIRYEEHEEDPYNKASAAYYGVEALQVYVPENHPYQRKDPAAIKEQIRQPVHSFLIRLKELVTGIIRHKK